MSRNANEKRGRLTGGALTAETLASSKSVFAPNRAGKTVGLQQYFTPRAVAAFIAHVAKGDKVLIGSSLVAVGPWVSDRLRERGINSVHITDEDAQGKARTLAPKKRAKAVADFRSGKSQVLCVGVNAMSLGHNLDVASVVIVDGLPWDFSTWDQFLKRARRLTSKKPVTVYIILPHGSLATEKWARLKDKTAAADLAMDGRLAAQKEEPIDQAALLRELQARGVRFDGTEIPEDQVAKAWYPQGIDESTNAA